jgi:peroxiredoxin
MKKTLFLAAAVLLLAAFDAGAVFAPWEIDRLAGKPAPDFTAADTSGKQRRLADYRGKVVLVNVWATWCPPCRGEMEPLAQLYERYHGRGFTVLAVSVDENPKAVRSFLKKMPLPFPVLLDPESKVAAAYRVFAYPTSVLVDRNGRVAEIITGAREWLDPEFTARLEKLLAKEEMP